jgi:cytochrome P450
MRLPCAGIRSRKAGPGFWVVTRHADVMRVNGDPATFSSQRGGILMNTPKPGMGHMLLGRASQDTMINLDAPQHMQLRREHMPFFTPAYLRGLTLKVQAEVTRLIDGMAAKGPCDMVEEFSSRLPLFTLCEILGVPEADRSEIPALDALSGDGAEPCGRAGGGSGGAEP